MSLSDLSPLNLGTQGRFDEGADYPLALGTQGRCRVVTQVPFDPTNVGSGGYPLPGEGDTAGYIKNIQADDDRVLMAVIKKFLEMRRDA